MAGLLHIVERPVGAGKTTFALRLSRELETPAYVLDDWMTTLFRPDRPDKDLWVWYAERKQRCIAQIWKLARLQLELGNDAIVELGLIRRADRRPFLAEVEAFGCDYRIHVLDAPEPERWRRVEARNEQRGETFAMPVSEEVFAAASSLWEPLDEAECAGRDVRLVQLE